MVKPITQELLFLLQSLRAVYFALIQHRVKVTHPTYHTYNVEGTTKASPDKTTTVFARFRTASSPQDLVSVRKNAATGRMEISPCKVYRITGINGHDQHHRDKNDGAANPERQLFPNAKDPKSPHHVCLLVADLGRRRASVLRKEFVPFW